MSKHRKDWTAWGAKRTAEHRRQRKIDAAIKKAIGGYADWFFRSGPILARLRDRKPFHGAPMQIPLQYRDNQ